MSSLELTRWAVDGPYDVVFSTRRGGISEGEYASLNLGFLSGDERERVEENRRRLYEAAAVSAERVSWPRQVHGADVVRAGARGEPADAIWTDEPGEAVMVVSADCAPVALARLDGRPAVGLAHVGWRGLLAGIIPAAVGALGSARVVAAIGPAIGPCCYEVGDDVAGPARATFGPDVVREGRFDLPGAVERALVTAGCIRVDRLGECTSCNPERYFSHRRDAGRTGRQGAIASIA